jgi:hypothetical protein
MIDNQKQVNTLMQKLKTNLPIPAKATDSLNLRPNSINIFPDSHIEITDVMYMGDEGGICCAIKIIEQEEIAVVVSLTHLRLFNTNPLSPDVRAYQALRTKKLAKRH